MFTLLALQPVRISEMTLSLGSLMVMIIFTLSPHRYDVVTKQISVWQMPSIVLTYSRVPMKMNYSY